MLLPFQIGFLLQRFGEFIFCFFEFYLCFQARLGHMFGKTNRYSVSPECTVSPAIQTSTYRDRYHGHDSNNYLLLSCFSRLLLQGIL